MRRYELASKWKSRTEFLQAESFWEYPKMRNHKGENSIGMKVVKGSTRVFILVL